MPHKHGFVFLAHARNYFLERPISVNNFENGPLMVLKPKSQVIIYFYFFIQA